jgi:ribonucleoside-diphosphate reductase alpha chain
MRAWEKGCKGFTVYRDGCRTGVLVRKDDKNDSSSRNEVLADNHAPKRIEVLDCNIHQVRVKGEAWTILMGLMNGRPYELFGGLSSTIEIPKKFQDGKILKRERKTKRSFYDLVLGQDDEQLKIKDVVNVFDNPTHGAFTRTLSLALRHGTPVQYVCEQLLKDEKDSDMFSFSRVMARVLKNYIPDGTDATAGDQKGCPDCESSKLAYQQGCVTCVECGWSLCS